MFQKSIKILKVVFLYVLTINIKNNYWFILVSNVLSYYVTKISYSMYSNSKI